MGLRGIETDVGTPEGDAACFCQGEWRFVCPVLPAVYSIFSILADAPRVQHHLHRIPESTGCIRDPRRKAPGIVRHVRGLSTQPHCTVTTKFKMELRAV